MRDAAKKQLTGVLLVAFAAVLWGWNGPMSKGLSMSGVDVLSLIVIRTFTCVVIGGVFLLRFDRTVFQVSARQLCFLFLYGAVVVAGTVMGFFYSLQYLSVSSGLLLHYCFPILTMVGSFLLIREKPNLMQIVSAFLIVGGVGLGVLTSSEQLKEVSVPGILWGLLAVVGISLQTLFARIASLNSFVSQTALLYHGFVWSLFTYSLCKTTTAGWGDLRLLTPSQWGLAALCGVVGMLVAQTSYFRGLRWITAPLGSLVSSLELVSATVFAVFLLQEIPSSTEIVGSVIVIFAIGLASFSKSEARLGA